MKKATNTIKDVFDDLNSHLSVSSSPLLSDIILSSPSPTTQDHRDIITPFPDTQFQESISDNDIKAGIIASMSLDQKLNLLQKRQRFMDRMRYDI